ncbi:MAG: hypothetical protein J5725_04375 [Bacteroidales bacterium]|nr:hypothetical protein [Bacteroidales bacterium]
MSTEEPLIEKPCCDTCVHYTWYYDRCEKYQCEVDSRGVYNCYKSCKETEE